MSRKKNKMLHSKRFMKIIAITIFIYFQLVMIELKKILVDEYCSVENINFLSAYMSKEIFYKQTNGLKCDIKNSNFSIDSERFELIKKQIEKYSRKNKKFKDVAFNWMPSNEKKLLSLTKHFNLSV